MEVQILSAILQYGTAPALLALVLIIVQMRSDLKGKVQSLQERVDELGTADSAVAGRVGAIERDYLSKEEHYQHISGWRGELHYLEQKIDENHSKTMEMLNGTVARLIDRLGELGDRRRPS